MTTSSRTLSTSTKIFALLCANAVIMYIDRTNISIAAPIIQKEMGLSNVSLGAAFSAFSVAYACFMVVGGRIGDIIGSRRGLLICGILWAIGTVCTGLIGGLVTLVAARLVVGLGEAAVYPVSSAVIARWIRTDRRGSAQGIMHGCGRLGAALTPAAVTALVLYSSWRYAFIILGCVSLVVTLAMFLYLRDDPRQHPAVTAAELEELGHEARKSDDGSLGRSPPMNWGEFIAKVWPVTLVSFCYGWFSWFLLSWVPLYFAHDHGLQIKKVAMFSTLVLIFGVAGMVGGGLATDFWLKYTGSLRRARRDIIIVAFLAALLCIVPLLVTSNLLVDTLALALGYFFIELADSSIWMLGMDVLPTHSATSTATVNTGFAIAGAVSPIIVGWLLDVTKSWNDVFALSIIVLLIGPLVVSRIRIHTDEHDDHGGRFSHLRNVS
ncbi:MAG TPA: MFS transporter [Stellaceae bacterium]|nr:MFS transporter [Stellaceae bacterium]